MPSLSRKLPEYRRFGKYARVSIAGQAIHLGKWGTPASKEKYDRLVAEWLVSNRNSAALGETSGVFVADCVRRFAEHIAPLYKTKSGRDTGTRGNYRPTLELLLAHYGETPAEEFGPLALKVLRVKMVQRGLSRRSINDAVSLIRRVFRHAVGEEMIDAAVVTRLEMVDGRLRGETTAPEPREVLPVEDAVVDATLEHLPRVVADMVRFQRLTGMRSGEIVQLRPCDLDRTRAVWRYVPREHKTEHHGIVRVICIGSQAQEVLRPYLERRADAECFSPREVWADRQLSIVRRRKPGTAYTNDSYRRAISRACEIAFGMPETLKRAPGKRKGIESAEAKMARLAAATAWRRDHCWHPHQLRHTAGTVISEQFDEFAAKAVLGHTNVKTTEIYAKRELKLAEKVALAIG